MIQSETADSHNSFHGPKENRTQIIQFAALNSKRRVHISVRKRIKLQSIKTDIYKHLQGPTFSRGLQNSYYTLADTLFPHQFTHSLSSIMHS